MSDEAREDIEKMIMAVGAICEMAGLMRSELMKQGFDGVEAFTICKEYVMRTLAPGSFSQEE